MGKIKKRPRKWVDFRHPDYAYLYKRWDFLLEAYEGGQEYIRADWELFTDVKPEANFIRHLHRHQRENADDYRDRITRAYYLNFCKPIVNIYRDHILRKGIQTETKDEIEWQEFQDDCTLSQMSLDHFMMKKIFPMTQVFGWSAILVDMDFFPFPIQTEAERKANNARPFVSRIYPSDFVNWQVGRDGKFDWVVFRERSIDEWDDPTNIKSLNYVESYKVITRDTWGIYDTQGMVLESRDKEPMQGTHNLKEVPIVIAINEEAEQYAFPIGMSAINDIADINKEIYNLCSLEQEFLYKQCLSILGIDEDYLGKILEFGMGNALPIKADGVIPQYITPPIDPAKYLSDKQMQLIQEIFRHAVVRDTTAITTGSAESGVSKAYDFHHSNQNIASKASSMQEAENQIAYYYYLWLNGGDSKKAKEQARKVKRIYPQQFDVKSINEEIEEVISILKQDLGSRTMNQELVNGIAKKMFTQSEIRDKVFAEIEKVDPGLNHEERLKRVQLGIMSVVDEILIQNPDLKDEEAKTKFEENLEINKKLNESKMVNTNPEEQRKKIADKMKQKGINVNA